MFRFLPILLAALLVGCARPKQQLNLFIWGEDLDPKIVADFETEFDCKVLVDYYDSISALIAKLSFGGDANYDVVAPGGMIMPLLIERGLLAPLRHENLPNLKNIDPEFLNPAFDPGNRYGAPYEWTTMGIYVRKPKGQPIEETWGLFFDPAKQPGPFVLDDDVRGCISAALLFKGYSVNSTDPKELAEVRDLLIATKKRSIGFSTANRNSVLARNAVLSIVNSASAVHGEEEDPETHFFIPREGSSKWIALLSIPARAPHRDLAEKFINYVLEPKVSAQLANFNRNATANKAAMGLINAADRNNPTIYPPAETMRRLEMERDLGETNKIYDELWMQVKAK